MRALSTLFLYLQIVLGAAVRHTASGLVCPELPLCYGSIWPTAGSTRLQMAHRIAALFVGGLIFTTTFRTWRDANPLGRFLLSSACFLVLAQIGLGMLSILTLLGPPALTAHLAVAALLLATMVSLTFGAPR